jgi:hypothetical protein
VSSKILGTRNSSGLARLVLDFVLLNLAPPHLQDLIILDPAQLLRIFPNGCERAILISPNAIENLAQELASPVLVSPS